MTFVFFDLETGGLDPKACAVTQIAAIVASVRLDGSVLLEESINLLVKPCGLELNEKALQVQGRTRAQVEAHPLTGHEALVKMVDWYQKYASGLPCYAWYAPFDAGFMDAMIERGCAVSMKHASFLGNFLPRDARDARALAQLLLDMGELPVRGTSLQVVSRHFGLAQAEPHDALTDATLGAQVLGRLVKMMKGGAA